MSGRLAFSLIEVCIALGIFAFVIVSVIGLFSVALHATAQSQQELGAANLATRLISDYKNSYADLGTNGWASRQFNLPSPPVGSSVASDLFVSETGSSATTIFSNAAYKVHYLVEDLVGGHDRRARLKLTFTWPPAATTPQGAYEVVTVMADRQ